MRKIAFTTDIQTVCKLMIYADAQGAYLFGYDSIADVCCIWDQWYEDVTDAEAYCMDTYNVGADNWIEIADPCKSCQHDLIAPVAVQDRSSQATLINSTAYRSFKELTGNERLYITGLMNELDEVKEVDRAKASKILYLLGFDSNSIEYILTNS